MEFFASTETERVFLFDGDQYWIEIKQELTDGERKRITAAAFRRAVANRGEANEVAFDMDFEAGAYAKAATYIADWNIPGRDGKVIDASKYPARVDALRNMKPEVFQAIEAAIDAKVEAREQEKKATAGPTTSND